MTKTTKTMSRKKRFALILCGSAFLGVVMRTTYYLLTAPSRNVVG